jgi:chromosome segregation ATPase
MRMVLSIAATLAAIVLTCATAVAADNDPKAAREHEQLRRTQEALRQSQSEASELAQSKTQAESKLKSTSEELDSLRNAAKSTQASLRSQLQTASAGQAELTRQLEDTKRRLAELTSKDQETATALKSREAELARAQADLQGSRSANSTCEAKNLKLYEYANDMAVRYQKKGVWASLSQKEPALGLKQVDTENLLQEYHEKVNAQRVPVAAPTH